MSSSPHTPRRTRPLSSTRPSPARTPLGPSRSLPLARSTAKTQLNSTAKQFFAHHSEIYAHLYEYPDEATKRERLDLEERRLEEERRRGREMRERLKGSTENMGLGGGMEGIREKGKGWRPLSLVAKRSPGGIALGHARSASATHNPAGIRSVSTPLPAHYAQRDISQTWNESDKLEVVLERSDSPTPSHRSSRDTPAASSQNHSTYSWATSFSGETAELRTTAQYVRKSLDYAQPYAEDQEEVMEDSSTPDKVKRRRKRIVALAHTVRQLEGVGSREAEDPDFYGVLVKAWNGRPGTNPIPVSTKMAGYPPASNGLTEGPPGLLPPPNLPTYSYPPRTHYSPNLHTYRPCPGHTDSPSTTFSPPDQYLHTPALGFSSSSTSTARLSGVNNGLYISADDAESLLESDLGSEGRRSGLRSGRYSYASALHDLGMEEHVETEQGQRGGVEKEGKGYGKGRWSGAWEGWAGGSRNHKASRMSGMGIRQDSRAAQPQPKQIGHYHNDFIDPGTPNRLSIHTDHLTPTRPFPSHPDQPTYITPTSRPLTSTSADVPAESTPKSGWGLGFMSAWWTDRPSSQVQDDASAGQSRHQMATTAPGKLGGDTANRRGMAGFQSGEEESLRPNQTLTQTRPLSLDTTAIDSPNHNYGGITPSPEIDRSYTLTLDSHDYTGSGSGTSTPSFGTRVHASAERRWIDAQSARPRLRLNVSGLGNTGVPMPESRVEEVGGGEISPSPWRAPMLAPTAPPPETGWSDLTINTEIIDHVLGYTHAHTLHQHLSETEVEKGVTPSASYTTTSSVTPEDGEKEFPFTKHCLPPTPSRTPSRSIAGSAETPLTTDSSFLSAKLGMAAVVQARALRETRDQQNPVSRKEEREYLDGSENGSYPSKPLHHLYHLPTQPDLQSASDEKKEKMEVLLPNPESEGEMYQPDRKGLLERRRIGPLRLGDLLNPLVLSSDNHLPLARQHSLCDQVKRIELQSSISHKMYLTTSGASPAMTTTTSTATTPNSAQTVFLPPHGTPMEGLTPTESVFPTRAEDIENYAAEELGSNGEAIRGISSGSLPLPAGEIVQQQYPWGRRYHLNRPIIPPYLNPDLNSNPSYYHSDSTAPGQIGGTVPVQSAPGQHSLCTSHNQNDLEGGQAEVGYRDPTPSIMTAAAEPQSQTKRNWSPVLFWLGFVMPWCWVFGGWPIGSTNNISKGSIGESEQDIEKATQPDLLTGKSWLRRWTHHPDPYVRRCRVAAGVGLPFVTVLAVVGVIVLAATR